MLEAKRVSAWRGRYRLIADGEPVGAWDGRVWRGGGTVELSGRRYDIRSNTWGTRFEMADEAGSLVAVAERVGRKQWTVSADGRTYQFRRGSWWRYEQLLVADREILGSVRRTSRWRSDAVADLPTLPPPLRTFVLAIVIGTWDTEAAAG